MKRRRVQLRVRTWSAPLAAAVVAALVVATGGAAFGAPRPRPRRAPAAAQMPAVHGVQPVTARFAKPVRPSSYVATRTNWPKARTTTVRPGKEHAGAQVWAESVPSAAAGPQSLAVDLLDHSAATAAGVAGVLLKVSADKAGSTRLGVDYSSFAEAYGGNYASRLRLASYPACVLTTPAVAACRQGTPLASRNDPKTSAVSAVVTLAAQAGTVVAATAVPATGEEGGAAGTYSATTLKPSGTWTSGSSTGDFTYAYPLAIAQAPSTLVPQIGLSYDSAATDGQTSATEAQASWAGEGWNTPNSFVEQSFQSCSEKPEGTAAPKKIYDQCYDGPIFTLSLNGSSTELVWDATKKVFKAADADGAVITHFCTKTTDKTCVAGTGNGSDSYARDWFQVQDRDGKTYSFGMNHLPGWSSDKTAVGSSRVDLQACKLEYSIVSPK